MNEKQAFLYKYIIFRKYGLKFLKNIFLKISLNFLVEDAKLIINIRIIILMFIMKEE